MPAARACSRSWFTTSWIDALDHDADGKKGGSKKQSADDDLSDLRSEYAKKFGKKPFNGWNADTLREKLEA
jgi:hypothetical protein